MELMVFTIINSTNAVIKKVITAEITAPKSSTTASVFSVAFTSTICNALVRSAPGIAFISGFKMPLTSELITAVNALPIITPTAISKTLPRDMNVLNSLKNFFIIFSCKFYSTVL